MDHSLPPPEKESLAGSPAITPWLAAGFSSSARLSWTPFPDVPRLPKPQLLNHSWAGMARAAQQIRPPFRGRAVCPTIKWRLPDGKHAGDPLPGPRKIPPSDHLGPFPCEPGQQRLYPPPLVPPAFSLPSGVVRPGPAFALCLVWSRPPRGGLMLLFSQQTLSAFRPGPPPAPKIIRPSNRGCLFLSASAPRPPPLPVVPACPCAPLGHRFFRLCLGPRLLKPLCPRRPSRARFTGIPIWGGPLIWILSA